MKRKIIEVRGVSKSFPGVQALLKVDFDLLEGEIHAVVGENGAGKSTLMKILGGSVIMDEGEIYLNGNLIKLDNPLESLKNGISVVYQELSLFPNMTVAENIFVARQPVGALNLIKSNILKKRAKELLSQLKLEIDVDEIVDNLSAAEKQQIEITKAISFNSKVLILDEPTSSLSINEIKKLFDLLKRLESHGVGIIYVSHHLSEIFNICNRVTVLRNGKKICTKKIKETDEKELIGYMIGKKIHTYFKKETKKRIRKDAVLEIRKLFLK